MQPLLSAVQGTAAAALVETAGGVASPGPSGSLQVMELTASCPAVDMRT